VREYVYASTSIYTNSAFSLSLSIPHTSTHTHIHTYMHTYCTYIHTYILTYLLTYLLTYRYILILTDTYIHSCFNSSHTQLPHTGTYSVGGGTRFEEWHGPEFPAFNGVAFHTYCSDIDHYDQLLNCSAWTLDGDHVHSGDNKDETNIASVLEVRVCIGMYRYVSA